MFREGGNFHQEEELESQEGKEPLSLKTIAALRLQQEEIASQERSAIKSPKEKEWSSSRKKWLRSALAAGVLLLPAFIAACNKEEKKQPEAAKTQEVKKVEKGRPKEVQKGDESGFTDILEDVLKRRVDLVKKRIAADRNMKEHIKKASPLTKEAAKDAAEAPSIVPQEDSPDVQRPSKNVRPGPSGKVHNEDL